MDSHSEDLRLAARVAEGDPVASAAFAERLAPRVRRLARSLYLGGHSDWEDAAQCSLVELLRAAHGYGGRSSLERWADRITIRTTLRLAKARRRERELGAEDHGGEELAAPFESDHGDVARHLASLDDDRRAVVVLRHVFGYGIDEIAELTRASRNTVKDRLVQGRRLLRKRIRRDELTPELRVLRGGA
ncbi:MAG: RNA polymerase sigma factor [Myxococcales bacterium]|nr:RNA polymerase sigma factor [Myxococcales bacterium]